MRFKPSFKALSQASAGDEIRRRSVLYGPHRDDVELLLDEKPVQRAYLGLEGKFGLSVLALKLAELLAARERNQHPVFLLDDLSSELDQHRTKQLVDTLEELGHKCLSQQRTQIFFEHCHQKRPDLYW